jgi:hypothetical protein
MKTFAIVCHRPSTCLYWCSVMNECYIRHLSASRMLAQVTLLLQLFYPASIRVLAELHLVCRARLLEFVPSIALQISMFATECLTKISTTGHPGTILSNVESKAFEEWTPGFYERLRAHTKLACDSIG